ncbi:MAG: hypothetical protein WEB06_02895 [Actinomycetota bacterium]
MKTLASGWCPRHDRVFERATNCPECGTALVPLASAKMIIPRDAPLVLDEPGQPEPEPSTNPWIFRAFIAMAMVGAFALGLVFPRNESPPVAQDSPGSSRELVAVQPQADATGAQIRLERMTQSGDRITASFRTLTGFSVPRLIEGAAVEVTVAASGGGGRSFGVSDVDLVVDANGFTLAGRLDQPGRVIELRISSIQVLAERSPEWSANVSSVWPVSSGNEPRVLRMKQPSLAVAGGSVRLTALIAWSDRLEAVFELKGLGGEAGNRAEIAGFELLTTSPGAATGTNVHGRSISASDTEQISAGQIIARFESVPADAGRMVIRATRVVDFIAGPWTWRVE